MKNKSNEVWIGDAQIANDPAYLSESNQEFHSLTVVQQLEDPSQVDLNSNRRRIQSFRLESDCIPHLNPEF